MNRTWKMMTPLLALGLAGVLYLVLRNPEPVVQGSPAVPQREEMDSSGSEKRDPVLTPASEPQEPIPQTASAVEATPTPPVLPVATRYSTNELMTVLPLWMREEAEVDAYADELVVAGTRVARVRGRYAWPNGSQMEVEISDLGKEPSDLLLRSLGYNTALTNTVTEAGFELHVDETNAPSNFEYDYGTGSGSMQLLVADRFLVEVQLELLLPESFEAVIEHQIPIAALKKMAAKDSRP